MVAEWEDVVIKFTELPQHVHYRTFSRRKPFHLGTLHGKPCRIDVISTIETFYEQIKQEKDQESKV
jgi:hypothetical protein